MDFIREKIKEKPINKKRFAMKIGASVLSGLIFAVTVCVVLLLFMPSLQAVMKDETEQPETESELEEVTEITEETEVIENPVIVYPEISLTIADYQELQNELYNIGNEVNKSIVTVTSMANETDWMNHSFERADQASGVIISEDANYLYILTEKKVITDASHIKVSFIDRESADATILKYDGNTGIAILTVAKREVSDETRNAITVAKIGNSKNMKNGSVVIAVGSPLGTNYSILTGNITSVGNKIMTQDKNYAVFTTDIVASEKGSGVLINTEGEIVGLVMQSFSGSQDIQTLTAVAIAEINGIIENLTNGKDIPYIGLYISTVTEDISEEYEIPKGVFIKEVVADSPAMKAGLQSGDVITKINGEKVASDTGYSNRISQLLPGTTCEISVKRQNGENYYDVTCMVEIGVLQ